MNLVMHLLHSKALTCRHACLGDEIKALREVGDYNHSITGVQTQELQHA